MATQTQIRRDSAANMALVTPALAELIYETTNKRLGVGDGTNVGSTNALFALMAKDLHKMAPIAAVATHDTAGNALSVTLDPAPTAYTTLMTVLIKASDTISGAATINVNGLGAKAIKKAGGAEDLEADDIVDGGIYILIYDGTNFQVISGAGAGAQIELEAAVNVTSGTEVTISSTIPAGVNLVLVNFDNVSLNGAEGPMLQLGDSGGIETTGYDGSVNLDQNGASNSNNNSAFTAGFALARDSAASCAHSGVAVLSRVSGNKWAATWITYPGTAVNQMCYGAGIKSLSGELTQIRVSRVSTNSFDGAGTMSVSYI